MITVAELAVAGALLAAVGLALGAVADALVGWGGTVALATSLLLALLHLVMPHLLAPLKRTSAALALHLVVHPLRTRRAAVALRRGGGPDGGAHMARLPYLSRRFFAPPPPSPAPAALEAKLRSLHAALCEHHYLGDAAAAPSLVRLLRRCPLLARRADGFRSVALQLAAAPAASLAAGLNVRFESEPALDASGVTRELFGLIAEQGVDDLLKPLDDGSLWLAPSDAEQGSAFADGFGDGDGDGERPEWAWAPSPSARRLAFGKLLGCFVAQACAGTDALVFPLPLSRALLALLCDAPLTAADARGADPVLFRFRVDALLEPGGIADVAMVMCEESLTFVADDDAATPLCDGGAAREVTVDNVHEYAARFAEHALVAPCRAAAADVLRGFWAVVPPSALRHAGVGAAELAALLHGESELPLDAWRAHAAVERPGGMGDDAAAAAVDDFFGALEAMDEEMRRKVLHFATGLRRLPPGGFARLTPPFTLQLLGEESRGRLPVAHTCFNALQLGPVDGGAAALARLLETSVEFGGGGFSDF